MINNLITGVSGFVASHLARYLQEQGEEVYGTIRWFEDLSRVNCKTVPMDLLDMGSILRVLEKVKPTYIFHLAAQSYVPESFDYPVYTVMTNMVGTTNLLEAIRVSGLIPIVHICSSSEVYGQVEESEIPIKETNPFRPQNPYGASKVGMDMMAYVYYQNYGIRIIRSRMFTHTGAGRTMMSAECDFARQIALIEQDRQKPIIKVGNLDSIRTIADVRDAVRAYHTLVRKGKYGDVYNIGGDTTMRVGNWLDYMLSLSDINPGIVVDPSRLRPADVTLQIPDCSKFKNLTGWKPEIHWKDTLKDVLNDWRKRV